MKPSSTSSSEVGAAHGRLIQFRPRILSATFAAILILLVATELVLRVPGVQAWMPIRTHFHEPGVVVRLQALERVKQEFRRVDILFVGSSIVRCNIRPLLFDSLMTGQGHNGVVSFNAGMSGLWPNAVDLYLEDLWLPEAQPRVVIQGIRYSELLPSPRARDYASIVTGPVESAWKDSGPASRLKAAAFERLHLLQYRGIWPSWLLRNHNGRTEAPEDDEIRVFTDPRGWTPRLPTLDVALAHHLLRDEKPNPALTDRRECEGALEAIRHSARAARRAGADYVLVNVPEHAFRWSGANGHARYVTYLDTLRQLAAAEGFPFVDVTDGDDARFSAYREYSDYHHMSPEGAARFTTLLAAHFGSQRAGLRRDQ
jgi:hypothetical protein